ncbi:hypothetical protein GALL_447090 [mine drainage metagenome]|uniref:Uncharacterized protein n=1 Tax=mine drainage metagenome TaxID=410659 RepID=A0A1J5PS67_9ZZZZ
MGRRRRHILGIAAARQQGANLIAQLPPADPRPHRGHHARPLQPGQVRRARRRRIGPRALQGIGPVHPGIGHANHDLAQPRHGHRPLAQRQNLRPARLGNLDSPHHSASPDGFTRPGNPSTLPGARTLPNAHNGAANTFDSTGLSRT